MSTNGPRPSSIPDRLQKFVTNNQNIQNSPPNDSILGLEYCIHFWIFFFKKVDWRTDQHIDTNLDLVDTPILDLPEGSLEGGNRYNLSVTVFVEKENKEVQKSQASITLDVESKGLSAMVTPSEVTASQQRPIKLSGILSEDLDNSHQPMQVCIYPLLDNAPNCLVGCIIHKR